MDRARFEFIGNVGRVEIKPLKGGRKFAVVSLATSERRKSERGDWTETTHWHRVAIFGAAQVARIEAGVKTGTRLRLIGQIRPASWEDERGHTRYSVEFIVSVSGMIEILARGKPEARAASSP